MRTRSRARGTFAAAAMFAAACVILSSTTDGEALTRTANVAVIANVNNNCTLTAGNTLAFGTYSGAQRDVSTTVRVRCNRDVNVLIRMGQGLAPEAGSTIDVPRRQLQRGAQRLDYFIYRDAGRTMPWGDSFASGLIVMNTRNNLNVPFYGRVPAGQIAQAGAYTDTVVVSIDY